MFGYKSNVSLVFDFMDTDMEVLIKDTSMVLTPANIKSYTLMTLKGLEYLHDHWILHRVGIINWNLNCAIKLRLTFLGSETQQLTIGQQWDSENWWFWSSQILWLSK